MQCHILSSREWHISDKEWCSFCIAFPQQAVELTYHSLPFTTKFSVIYSLQGHFSHISLSPMITLLKLINVKYSITSGDPNLLVRRGEIWSGNTSWPHPVPSWDDKHTAARGLIDGLLFMPALPNKKQKTVVKQILCLSLSLSLVVVGRKAFRTG